MPRGREKRAPSRLTLLHLEAGLVGPLVLSGAVATLWGFVAP